jgi:predicted lipoprotein with Yx(FWY)xxD motif
MIRVRVVGLLLVATALLAGCGDHRGSSSGAGRPGKDQDVTLSVRTIPGFGAFVVRDGWTLYMYPPDRQRRVTCTGVEACDTAWPPVFVGAGRSVIAGPGIKKSLIGSIAGDGGRIVTYNRWPLYYYVGDRKSGAINGQGQGFNWYVVAPDGTPKKTDLAPQNG